MKFIPGRVLQAEPIPGALAYRLTLALEKPLIHPPGSSAVVCFLDGEKTAGDGYSASSGIPDD
jgi:hypothetical protein